VNKGWSLNKGSKYLGTSTEIRTGMRTARNAGLNRNRFRTGMEKISLAGMSMSEKAGSQRLTSGFFKHGSITH
jgi:hypothetical protein